MIFWQRRSTTSLFEVRAAYHNDFAFPTCWISNIDDVDLQWGSGRPIERPLPDPIEYKVDKNLPLDDLMITSGGPVLVSEALLSLVSEVSTCAKGYASIVFFEDQPISRSCWTVNFERSFSCLDLGRSRFSEGKYSPDKYNGILEKMIISMSKIPQHEQIFRLGESPTHLIATQVFRDEVVTRNLTGFQFTEVHVVDS